MVFPFYKYLKTYDALEYFPMDQGGRLIQLELVGSESDRDTIGFVRSGGIERVWGEPIDWGRYENSVPRQPEKHVWLHRWYFLLAFARRYLVSSRREYLDEILSFIRLWHEGNPCPDDFRDYYASGKYAWKDMQVAWRTLVMAMTYHMGNKGFSTGEKEEIKNRLVEHSRILLEDFGKQAYRDADNHQAHGGLAIFAAGVLFPDLPEREELVKTGFAILSHHLKKAFYPDGNSLELSPGYYPFISSIFRDAYLLAEANGFDLEVLWRRRLAESCGFMKSIQQPDGTMPPVNDSTEMPCRHLVEILEDILGKGEDASDTASACFKYSNQAVMRNGNNDYMFIDADSSILWHGHAGKPGFHLWWNGVPLLGDSGVCSYDDPLRAWYYSAPAHNTVIIDGLGDFDKGRLRRTNDSGAGIVHWATGKKFDYAVAEHRAWGRHLNSGLLWRRHFIMVRNAFVIILDSMNSEKEHDYHWIFHPLVRNVRTKSGNKSFYFEKEGVGLLTAPFKASVFSGFSTEEAFMNRRGGNLEAMTANYKARASDFDAAFILFPSAAESGAADPVLSQCDANGRLLLRIEFREKCWTLEIDKDSADSFDFDEKCLKQLEKE